MVTYNTHTKFELNQMQYSDAIVFTHIYTHTLILTYITIKRALVNSGDLKVYKYVKNLILEFFDYSTSLT